MSEAVLMTDWAGIHGDKGFRASSIPLSVLSFLYGIGVRIHLKNIRLKKMMTLPGFTISIGNITAGGTGKTPATCMIAEWAIGQGYNAAILSRGYGGQNRAGTLIVSDGRNLLAGPKEAGDEPWLLGKKLPGIPVITAKNRYLAGMEAHNRFGSDFFILDDGYQHLMLKRDLNLLLLDKSMPFGNGWLLPRGPLREPLTELSRADAVILTRAGMLYTRGETAADITHRFPGKPIFKGEHLPEKVVLPFQEMVHDPSFLKGKRVVAFAGIAKPDSFRATLTSLGAEILSFKTFYDHHPFTGEETGALFAEKERTGADLLITTEKEWTRVRKLVPEDPFMSYLTIRFDILSEREAFFRMIAEKAGNRCNTVISG
jgi:tetraacyldisaccharide 4'-kinase